MTDLSHNVFKKEGRKKIHESVVFTMCQAVKTEIEKFA